MTIRLEEMTASMMRSFFLCMRKVEENINRQGNDRELT